MPARILLPSLDEFAGGISEPVFRFRCWVVPGQS